MQDLNTSLDSLELEIYHKPNHQITSILSYLRSQNLKFCTDPKEKQEKYYHKDVPSPNPSDDFGISKNRFFNKRMTLDKSSESEG